MKSKRRFIYLLLILLVCLSSALFNKPGFTIPKTWDIKELELAELPPPDSSVKVKFVPEAYYYNLPEWEIFKTYPVYLKGHAPKGYNDSLRKLAPVKIYFDPEHIKTQADWVKAGEAVFNWPVSVANVVVGEKGVFTPDPVDVKHPEVTSKFVYPFAQLVVAERGKVTIANQACASCHTRVTASGETIPGAQGTNDFDGGLRAQVASFKLPATVVFGFLGKPLFYTPWVKNESEILNSVDSDAFFKVCEQEPPGVISRQGIALFTVLPIPSLIGIKDIKYLDKTGLMKHRGPGDLMRYAALNQGMDMLTSFNGYIPLGVNNNSVLPKNQKEFNHPFNYAFKRYSDAQLYALTQYIYSLKPPKNPNKFPAEVVKHGQTLFAQQGCVTCHTPPLYTNNKLTPALGFEPKGAFYKDVAIFNVSVETDSVLTMASRRGTGFYKIPSLRGLWYRQNYLHGGHLATLEDLFDPSRLSPAYVPTGVLPMGSKHSAVKGHEFGLALNTKDRSDMISFLKTL